MKLACIPKRFLMTITTQLGYTFTSLPMHLIAQKEKIVMTISNWVETRSPEDVFSFILLLNLRSLNFMSVPIFYNSLISFIFLWHLISINWCSPVQNRRRSCNSCDAVQDIFQFRPLLFKQGRRKWKLSLNNPPNLINIPGGARIPLQITCLLYELAKSFNKEICESWKVSNSSEIEIE